jgi:TM2 domain-containing membrane protein YozV
MSKANRYRITNATFQYLQQHNVPNDIILLLETIKHHEIAGEDNFLDLVKYAIGYEHTEFYRSILLAHAQVKGFGTMSGGFYKITGHTLSRLKIENAPDEVLLNLILIKDLEYKGKTNFLNVLNEVIGAEYATSFGELIVKWSSTEEWNYSQEDVFIFTTLSLAALKPHIPEDVLNQLKLLKNKKIDGLDDLLDALNETIGKTQTESYKSLIYNKTRVSGLNYMISARTLELLKKDKVPKDVLLQLESLENQVYPGKTVFMEILTETLGYAKTNQYAALILKHSKPGSEIDPKASKKTKFSALLLCILFGWLGFHRYYVNKYGTAIFWMFTFGGFGIFWIIDIILILTGRFKDNQKKPLTRWF